MTKGPRSPSPTRTAPQSELLSFPGGLSGRFLTSGCRPRHAEHGAQPGGLPGSCNYWERLTPATPLEPQLTAPKWLLQQYPILQVQSWARNEAEITQ